MLDDFDQQICGALESKGRLSSRQISEIIGLSRQATQVRLKRLVASGHVRVEGRARATRYGLAEPRWSRTYGLEGLEEHIAFDELHREFPPAGFLEGNAADVLAYAVTQMVNNAIDHSGGSQCELCAIGRPSQLLVEVIDDGVGVFRHVRERLDLPDELAALQEISKGKTTTDEQRHSDEGLFFVSKAVTTFALASGSLRWLVDNIRDDVAIEALDDEVVGTRVTMTLIPNRLPELTSVFDAYTRDLRFVRTRTRVKLFDIGSRFMSRSEAKRLMHGLDRFEAVTLDFEGVQTVGQGFADEVFRVWAKTHTEVELDPVNMRDPVAFMVRRALGLASVAAGAFMTASRYQQSLWRFHREHFFDFEKVLSPTERSYIETCQHVISRSPVNEYEAETSLFGYRHFSSYTYSHRVRGDDVNSSRIAFGSVTRPDKVRPAAFEVIRERDVAVDPVYVEDAASFFYGLGWDVEAEQFKIYFRVLHERMRLPADHVRLLELVDFEIRPEILVSFTYTGSKLSEEKVYAYAAANGEADDPATLQVAHMISTQRGVVEQADIRNAAVWADRLNGVGRDIIRRYQTIGETVDTIAYQGPDRFTLYFP